MEIIVSTNMIFMDYTVTTKSEKMVYNSTRIKILLSGYDVQKGYVIHAYSCCYKGTIINVDY